MKFNWYWSGAALTALTIAFAGSASAQETTSAVRGQVLSEGGAPIAGASVTVLHTPTNTRSSDVTDASGAFDVRGLHVGGPYSIEVSAPEYEGERIEDVFLSVGNPFRIVVDLAPSMEDIIVVAAPRTAGVQIVGSGTRLDREEIESVVSVTRDIRDLARRDPLVSQNARGDGGLSIGGSNPRTNRITIDGVQAQDDFGLNTGGLPTRRGPVSLDAINQLAVEAVPFDVENGDFLGGAINVVLANGENDFSGSGFINYLNEGLVGTRIANAPVRAFIRQQNYGATLRGPILRDRLFFALAYETYQSADATSLGPAGQGFAQTLQGPSGDLTLADISNVTDVFDGTNGIGAGLGYGSTRPFGEISPSAPITDEKFTARLDWNITDDHRAIMTYRHSESALIQRTNLTRGSGGTPPSAGLDSQWYTTGEDDTTYSVQINSDWTNSISTEVRYSLRDYTRLQEPPFGQNFADIRVCPTETSLDTTGNGRETLCRGAGNASIALVRFGPDQFRHANFLDTQNQQFQASAEFELGDHLLKVGGQWQSTGIYNLFLPNSDGTYYFDSIEDFENGLANELVYRNAVGAADPLNPDPTTAAANFTYDVFSALVQDSWDVTDNLTVNYGLRWDVYEMDDRPVNNPNFATRYPGRSNQRTYDGLDVLMPRISFTYDPTDNLSISGGVGLFSGGLPDVFLSNIFGNTGILDNQLTFRRTEASVDSTSVLVGGDWFTETSGAVNCSLTPAICTDALNVLVNPDFGAYIPDSVNLTLSGLSAPTTSEVNVLAPNFEIPSDWRGNISVAYDIADFRLGLDAVYTRSEVNLAFRDIRANPLTVDGVQQRTPDGRIRYDNLNTFQRNTLGCGGPAVCSVRQSSSNRDIEAYNPSQTNENWLIATSIARSFENGVDLGLAYTWQNYEDFSSSARFSSTASSLYGSQFADIDPNTASYGRAQEEVERTLRYNADWRHTFVSDLETRFSLYGEMRDGRPVSFTMFAGSGRNATFGVNRGGQLAYIPNLSGTLTTTTGISQTVNGVAAATGSATTISGDSTVSFDSVSTYNNLVAMVNQFNIPQGGIVERGSYENEDINRIDLQLAQEIPAFARGHRALLTFDIQNLANLINDDWGVVQEFPEDFSLFNVSCAGADGVADDDGIASCARYRISSVNTTQGRTRNTDLSRWTIQIGLRYQF